MTLTPRIIIVSLAVSALAAAALVWKFGPDFRGARPAAASTAPAGTVIAPPAKPDANGLALERDNTAVFQRAFWRRPASDDRILHAERRDWMDASSGVEKWQWFIAVQPSAAFREWLIKDNPFELVAVAPAEAPAEISSPPAWFPPAAELARFARYRNREGRYLVYHDVTTNRLCATDAGGGFAAARK
jgi:hypothetical protein